jgi:hypothetical protein
LRYRWIINGTPQQWQECRDDLWNVTAYAPFEYDAQFALEIDWPERRKEIYGE